MNDYNSYWRAFLEKWIISVIPRLYRESLKMFKKLQRPISTKRNRMKNIPYKLTAKAEPMFPRMKDIYTGRHAHIRNINLHNGTGVKLTNLNYDFKVSYVSIEYLDFNITLIDNATETFQMIMYADGPHPLHNIAPKPKTLYINCDQIKGWFAIPLEYAKDDNKTDYYFEHKEVRWENQNK